MSFHVQTTDPVIDYLAKLADISPDGLARLVEEYTQELGDRADHFLERHPVSHESYSFYYDTVLVDGNNLWEFNFVVDASAQTFGVVAVVYVEARLLGSKP